QRAWLLACSLTLLLFGLGLYFARLPRPFYWLVVLGVSLGAVLAGIWWPSVLPAAIYGCVPGALVLAAVVAFQWMVQREYRRRVVFMPGFTRLKPGSSLFRPGSSGRPRGEPSTVDQQPGSGQRALVPSQKAENNAP
ncbi:MAG TPA: hypothetical protein VKI65_14785, partial [Gemmataceae bacterium]|nr:hypothetical protein [Gemmataceae bacterium]